VLSFNLGHERFAQMKLDSGLTREEWYKKKIEIQEKNLRDTIIAKLKIPHVEWIECLNNARKSVFETENNTKQQERDIRGNWIANYRTGALYKTHDSQKKLDHQEVLFEINDKKIAAIKRMLKDFEYSGEIVTLYPEQDESLTAYQHLITIRPDLFLYDTADQAFRLSHELSHIQRQDIIFERAIKIYVQRCFRTDFDPAIHKTAEETFDIMKLKENNITLDDIDQIYDLLMKVWWIFHEYRADMDALFAMKNYEAFKKKIKNQAQYRGYPLNYHYCSMYEKNAPVPYIQDFIAGLINDSK